MNATTIEAYALSKGIDTTYKDMNNATKVQLAMQMFLEKTTYAAGNYAKENETLAGSLGTAKAALANFLSGAGDVDSLVNAFTNASDVIIKNLSELLPRLSTGLTEVIQKLIPQIPPLLNKLLPSIIQGATALLNGLMAAMPALLEVINNITPVLVESAIKLIQTFIQAVVDNSGLILEAGKNITSALLTGIGDLIPFLSPITNALNFLITNIESVAVTTGIMFAAWKGVELLSFIQQSGGVVSAIGNITKAMELLTLAKLKDKAETIALTAMYAKDFIVSMISGTATIGKQIIEWGALTIAKIADKVATVAATVAQYALNLAMSLNPIGLIVAAIASLIAFIVLLVTHSDEAKEVLLGVWDSIKNGVKGAIDAVINFFKGLIQFFIENWKEILIAIINPIAGAIAFLYKLNPEFKKWVDGIIDEVKKLPDKIKQFFDNIIQGFKDWVKNSIDVAKKIVPDFIDKVVTFFKELPGKLLEIGKDMINGLWEGIKNKAKEFVDNITKFFKGIIDGVKGILGIHSPSKVFASMGENTGKGFINGILGMSRSVKKAVDNVFGNLGGDIGFNANFGTSQNIGRGTNLAAANTSSFTSPIYNVTVNVSSNDMDNAAKVIRVFENFSHNSIVQGGL